MVSGLFLSKPQIVEGVKTSGNMQALLQLLASLMAPEVNIDTVCAAITSDARLTYKILKLANGASKISRPNLAPFSRQCYYWASTQSATGPPYYYSPVTAQNRKRFIPKAARAQSCVN